MSKMKSLFLITAMTFSLVGGDVKGSFSDYEKEFLQQPEKLEQWNAMACEVDSWVDGLGMPIDEQIKETVIVLNLLGFETYQSCEGHADWGLPYPWIQFNIYDDEYRNLQKEISMVQKQIQEMGEWNSLSDEEKEKLKKLHDKNRELFAKFKMNIQSKLAPVYSLLEKFYNEKNGSYDRVICFPSETFPRMQSLGGQWEHIRTPAQKQQKLEEYQCEMAEFTDFLIREFLKQK